MTDDLDVVDQVHNEVDQDRVRSVHKYLRASQIKNFTTIGREYVVRPPNTLFDDQGLFDYHEVWKVIDKNIHPNSRVRPPPVVRLEVVRSGALEKRSLPEGEFLRRLSDVDPFVIQDVARAFGQPRDVISRLQLFTQKKRGRKSRRKRSTRRRRK